MGVGGQRHAPAALSPGKTRYPLYKRLGGPQGRSGRVRKISPPPGFDLRTVQPVASRYIDWAIGPHDIWSTYPKHWGLNRFRDVCRPSSRGRVTDDDGDGSADWWSHFTHTQSLLQYYAFQHRCLSTVTLIHNTQQLCARHYSCYFHEKYITHRAKTPIQITSSSTTTIVKTLRRLQ